MDFLNRYDKSVIEPFALLVISKSYNEEYSKYFAPKNPDNFDFISVDGKKALEVTTVIPQNEMEAYIYEKERYKGNSNPKIDRIRDLKLHENGDIISYYGGSMHEIKKAILKSLNTKHKKALKRLACIDQKVVDICICVQDGSLFDLKSFENAFDNFDEYVFENIFFVTPSHFVRYHKEYGFKEYKRVI